MIDFVLRFLFRPNIWTLFYFVAMLAACIMGIFTIAESGAA